MYYFAAVQKMRTVELPVFSLTFDKSACELNVKEIKNANKTPPIKVILALELTTNQNMMNEPYFEFLNLDLYFP